MFEDKISTRRTNWAGLAGALDYLRLGDTLCVWKLDRLGRSVKQILTIADDLHERGIGLRILTGRRSPGEPGARARRRSPRRWVSRERVSTATCATLSLCM